MALSAKAEKVREVREVLIHGISELPVLPSVLMEVMALDPDGDDYFERILDLAEQDPSFAVRVLALANSALYGRGRTVTSARQAITRLGARAVRELITSMSVARVFVPLTDGQRNLWLHAIQVAVAARTIAGLANTVIKPEEAYLAGLLHDIGRFIMFQVSPEELGQVDETGWRDPRHLIAAELRICGLDHAQLGARAAEKWGLPTFLQRFLAAHHVGDPCRLDPGLRELVLINQEADLLSLALLEEQTNGVPSNAGLLARKAHQPNFLVHGRKLIPHVERIRNEAEAVARALKVI